MFLRLDGEFAAAMELERSSPKSARRRRARPSRRRTLEVRLLLTAPSATDDDVYITHDTSISSTTNVLSNDINNDNADPLSASLVSNVSHGSCVFTALAFLIIRRRRTTWKRHIHLHRLIQQPDEHTRP